MSYFLERNCKIFKALSRFMIISYLHHHIPLIIPVFISNKWYKLCIIWDKAYLIKCKKITLKKELLWWFSCVGFENINVSFKKTMPTNHLKNPLFLCCFLCFAFLIELLNWIKHLFYDPVYLYFRPILFIFFYLKIKINTPKCVLSSALLFQWIIKDF